MGSLGPLEIIIIGVLVLVLFGAKRIPEVARGLGKGIREFRKATNEISRELTIEEKRPRIQSSPHTYTYAPPQSQQAPPPSPTESSAQKTADSPQQ